jgi:hypothetical protein
MSRYRVGFDQKWQESFDNLGEAIEYAEEAAESGRMVWVAERRGWFRRDTLRAAFPEDQAERAEAIWRNDWSTDESRVLSMTSTLSPSEAEELLEGRQDGS